MRFLMTFLLLIWAQGAFAHVGHVAEVAGHGHWVGAAAIGLAVLVGLYGKAKANKDKGSEADADQEEDSEEVPA